MDTFAEAGLAHLFCSVLDELVILYLNNYGKGYRKALGANEGISMAYTKYIVRYCTEYGVQSHEVLDGHVLYIVLVRERDFAEL